MSAFTQGQGGHVGLEPDIIEGVQEGTATGGVQDGDFFDIDESVNPILKKQQEFRQRLEELQKESPDNTQAFIASSKGFIAEVITEPTVATRLTVLYLKACKDTQEAFGKTLYAIVILAGTISVGKFATENGPALLKMMIEFITEHKGALVQGATALTSTGIIIFTLFTSILFLLGVNKDDASEAILNSIITDDSNKLAQLRIEADAAPSYVLGPWLAYITMLSSKFCVDIAGAAENFQTFALNLTTQIREASTKAVCALPSTVGGLIQNARRFLALFEYEAVSMVGDSQGTDVSIVSNVSVKSRTSVNLAKEAIEDYEKAFAPKAEVLLEGIEEDDDCFDLSSQDPQVGERGDEVVAANALLDMHRGRSREVVQCLRRHRDRSRSRDREEDTEGEMFGGKSRHSKSKKHNKKSKKHHSKSKKHIRKTKKHHKTNKSKTHHRKHKI